MDDLGTVAVALGVAIALIVVFQEVDNMCTFGVSSQLYDKLRMQCEEYIHTCLERFSASDSIDSEQFLKLMNRTWQSHCEQMVSVQ